MSALALAPGPAHAPVRRGHLHVVPDAPATPPAHGAAAAPIAEEPLRLTDRGRRVLAALGLIIGLVLAITAGSLIGSAVSAAGAAEGADPMQTVVVASGDTLWSIASAAAGEGQDLRPLMDEIRDLNGLQGSTLAAGTELVVPAGG